jgi:predicted flap endonuclease-1-like 5' DNA nuclease
MLTLPAAVLLCAAALALGLIAGWLHFRRRTAAGFLPLSAHLQEQRLLRRHYRRRLRSLRDAVVRHRLNEEQLRGRLRQAESAHGSHEAQLADLQQEIADLRERSGELERLQREQERLAVEARRREEALAAELARVYETTARFERDHGLLRIERDELAARTQRLRALAVPDRSAAEESPAAAAATVDGAMTRAEIADRDARIHELECQLRESRSHLHAAQADLQTWKYRIAPLALHMKIQRDKARQAVEAQPTVAGDDLRLIRGIGRGLQKKLRAEGVTGIAQIARMTSAELAALSVRVGLAPSRPERDRWAEQARQHCAATGVTAA